MRTRRLSCRVTEEEYEAILDYCKATDYINVAAFLRHAAFAQIRRDKRRLSAKYHRTMGIE